MWTADLAVEFTPLPEEMEEAYWAALAYFAEVILNEFQAMNVDESLVSE